MEARNEISHLLDKQGFSMSEHVLLAVVYCLALIASALIINEMFGSAFYFALVSLVYGIKWAIRSEKVK